MWSDRYNYYNIQSDPSFTQKVETNIAIDVLVNTNCFKQKNHQTFSNADSFPWVDICLVETADGNYASSDEANDWITLIAIVCSKGDNIDQAIYINIFSEIARRLNWKLYLEADDNGNENIEITGE